MVTPEVYPQAAAAAGCTASYSVDHTDNSSSEGWSQSLTYYQLSATAALNWRFSHFEWTQVEYTNQVYSTDLLSDNNPCTHRRLYEGIFDWGPVYEDVGLVDSTYTITYCRAVFVEDPYGDITVTTSADPAAGGTTAPVTETHQYSGSASTTFTLVATPNNGWRFVNWKLNGAMVATTNTTTVTHTFTSYAQTFHYVATFRRTGLILHGVGGAILHGSNGTILHSG